MKKDLNYFGTFVINSCKHVTNHEVINNELVVTTKTSDIFLLLDELKKTDNLNFEMLLDLSLIHI